MTTDDSVLAVIPARGGSKRVPRKNVAEVGGKPLVAHAVEQTEQATTIDEAVVSTEDEEIKRLAREYGGNVPFDRPPKLATDTATSRAVIEHALSWFEAERDRTFDVVAMIQATTPLRTSDDIDGAIRRLRTTDAASVVSITDFRTPPVWAVYEDDHVLKPYFEGGYLWTDEDVPRSQDVPTLYYPNGAVFAAETEVFLDAGSFYTDQTVGYEMPPERSIDIDDPFDLRMVRALLDHDDERTE